MGGSHCRASPLSPVYSTIATFTNHMEPPFLLSKHVFLSLVDDYCVFLDLKKDRYLSIERSKTRAFEHLIAGWPRDCQDNELAIGSRRMSSDDASVLALADRGLLTRDPSKGKGVVTVALPAPTSARSRRDLSTPITLSSRDVEAFMIASIRAATMLRWQSIESTVRRVQERKVSRSSDNALDIDETERLLAVFETLRPFFPAKYLCLFDSLVLLEFLAINRLFPDWIFGVRVKPWHAHCWLQQSDLVLNDALHRVRSFTPIMVV